MGKRKSLMKTIIYILLTFFLIFSFYNFIKQTNQLNTSTTLEHLKDTGKETANNFNQRFNSLSKTLKTTAELIGNDYTQTNDIGNILDSVQKNNKTFQRIWYVDMNKHLYNYKDNLNLDAVNDYADRMLKGESGITDPFESPITHRMVVVIYNPIYHNQKIIGGISGIVEINNENHDFIYNDIFNDEAYGFVVATDGQIISKIKNNSTLYNGNKYFDFLKKDVKYLSGNYENILKDIEKEKSDFISYEYQGQERMIYYTPVQINDWYVFTIISKDIITNLNDNMNQSTFLLILQITFAFSMMLLFIIRYYIKINKRNQNTNNQLKTSNAKIEMILKQTSDRIFEYDIYNDSLVLDAWNDFPQIILNSFLSNLHNYNFVSKDHENLLKEKLNKIISDHEKIVFDAKFPYISKDEETWFHVSIVYMENNNRLIGIMRNSTKEMLEYNDLMQDQMFKNAIYSHALFMFAMNLKSRKVVVYQENGVYHNIIDEIYEGDFLNGLIQLSHENDRERVSQFFDYNNVQNICHHNGKNKVEYRSWNANTQRYEWIRFRIQFERQTRNNELLMIAYSTDINEEKSRQLEYEFKAQRDGLTGLYNRQTFNQFVDNYLSEGIAISNYCAYMIIDLDDFKSINDSLGHSVGDHVIQDVAHILDSTCHQSSMAARFGGDEFILFFYEHESYAEIENQARIIIQKIENIQVSPVHPVSASIGIAFVKDEKNHDVLFDKCDQALYICKNSGKGRYYVYLDE